MISDIEGTAVSETILEVQNLVGGYGKMTILNGTSFSAGGPNAMRHL